MYYVELLRARRALLIGLVWLGVALALNLILFRFGRVHVDSTKGMIPLDVVWVAGSIIASIFASVLASSLAAENEEHLPLAWSKPASRTSYALAKIGVDAAAIALMFGAVCIVAYAYIAMIGFASWIEVTPDSGLQFVRFLLAPFAIYGLMQALTSTLGRTAGGVIGFTWIGMIAVAGLGSAPLPQPWHALFGAINLANPLVYMALEIDEHGTVISYALNAATLGLALITVLGIAAAVYRWQRVEA